VSDPGLSSGRRCPICGKPTEPRFKPFCSARCANVDLNRWLSGTYAIPGEPVDNEPQGQDDDES
jgi:endogenous inhibitor of DNA gyrase (YacG/DUF329 family)